MSKSITGTKEWCPYTENFISGCAHDCIYCYAKDIAIRFKRETPNTWKDEHVREKDLKGKFRRRGGRIMFPSSHDITPEHLDESIKFLKKILDPGNEVLIVSKPHLECIERICTTFADAKDRILFRFTVGSASSDTLRFWEPNAPDYAERLSAIQLAYSKGFPVSIVCEPMLDDRIEDVINDVAPFVSDSIWLGKGNLMFNRVKRNGGSRAQLEAVIALENLMSDEFIQGLYDRLKDNPMIKWKDSIKKVVGIPLAEEAGLDV